MKSVKSEEKNQNRKFNFATDTGKYRKPRLDFGNIFICLNKKIKTTQQQQQNKVFTFDAKASRTGKQGER